MDLPPDRIRGPGFDTRNPPTFRCTVWALAGGGCSPQIFAGIDLPGVCWQPLDWVRSPGPHDPGSVADWLGGQLAQRQGPTLLAGHSLGAFIALLTAIRHPQHVDGLILSNTGARIEGHGDPGLPQRIREQWDAQAQAEYLRQCFLHPPAPALWQQCLAYLRDLPVVTLLEGIEGLRRMDLSAELGRVRCPTLVAHGRLDTRRPIESALLMARCIPGARLALLPGGHTPMVDCRAEYIGAVNAFLAGLGLADVPPHPNPNPNPNPISQETP